MAGDFYKSHHHTKYSSGSYLEGIILREVNGWKAEGWTSKVWPDISSLKPGCC